MNLFRGETSEDDTSVSSIISQVLASYEIPKRPEDATDEDWIFGMEETEYTIFLRAVFCTNRGVFEGLKTMRKIRSKRWYWYFYHLLSNIQGLEEGRNERLIAWAHQQAGLKEADATPSLEAITAAFREDTPTGETYLARYLDTRFGNITRLADVTGC